MCASQVSTFNWSKTSRSWNFSNFTMYFLRKHIYSSNKGGDEMKEAYNCILL